MRLSYDERLSSDMLDGSFASFITSSSGMKEETSHERFVLSKLK